MGIIKREDVIVLEPTDPEARRQLGWWYSPTAYIVKWAFVLALFLLFFLWVTVGYVHARRRVRKGMTPMAYHRWLVPHSQRPPAQNSYGYYDSNSYGMYGRDVEPPPVYTNSDLPPTYQPPMGGTKVAPRQSAAPAYEPRAPEYGAQSQSGENGGGR